MRFVINGSDYDPHGDTIFSGQPYVGTEDPDSIFLGSGLQLTRFVHVVPKCRDTKSNNQSLASLQWLYQYLLHLCLRSQSNKFSWLSTSSYIQSP